MLEEADDLICWDEEAERSLYQYLREFEDKIWPVYRKFGYTKDTAILHCKINVLVNITADANDGQDY